MRYQSINPSLFIKNREKLSGKLKPNSLAIIHSNDVFPRNGDQDFPYRQNSDLFYLTGLDQKKCILCLFPDHPNENLREVVFIIKSDEQMETWYGRKYKKEDASKISGVKTIKWLSDFESTINDLIVTAENIYLNANEHSKFFTEILYQDLRFAKKLKKYFPTHNYERLAPLITELRMVKEKDEIELMQKACNITKGAFERVLKFVKPGVLEYEVEAELTHEYTRNGCSGHAYFPIVASGVNACILHYNENDAECKDGDLLLLDFGAEYANYAADCSRTIPINGKFSPRQKECYEAVLRVFKKAKKMLVPGTTIDSFNKEVNKLMEKEMIGLGLFTREEASKQDKENPLYFKYYMHGTAHFIGIDVHDVGTKYAKFEKGMVLTCEPGIYLKEEGIGIRIENNIVVDDKPVDLMNDIPFEVKDIERLMQKS